MALVEVVPWLAGIGVAIGLVAVTLRPAPAGAALDWRVPGLVAALLLAWSLVAVIAEGPLGFWPEHTRNLWGNQIWFDLLLAAGCAWVLLLPRARAAGMHPLPWLVLVLCSGSIGLLAMLAQVLRLEAARRTG